MLLFSLQTNLSEAKDNDRVNRGSWTDWGSLTILCFRCNLDVRQTKYILWKFVCKKSLREIAKLDGKGLTYQAIDQIIRKEDSIILTGYVKDIRPYFENTSVYVCPLRWGTGIKNKLLEAWAMSKPIVATSVSKEGLGAVDNENILIADKPSKFADCVIKLLNDNKLREKLGQKGRQLVETSYTWQLQSSRLEGLFNRILKN